MEEAETTLDEFSQSFHTRQEIDVSKLSNGYFSGLSRGTAHPGTTKLTARTEVDPLDNKESTTTYDRSEQDDDERATIGTEFKPLKMEDFNILASDFDDSSAKSSMIMKPPKIYRQV